MTFATLLLLFSAGVVGGVMNALAGGATLVTFPAMLATGLPAIVANASNALAVTPGHAMAAFADRGLLRQRTGVATGALVAALGGLAGAILLLVTPERIFTLLVPALIGLATLIFALGPRLQHFTAHHATTSGRRTYWLLPVSIYGGYFGAGLGVMLLALLTVTGREELRMQNVLKNLYATVAGLAGVAIFAVTGTIHWPSTFAVLTGAIAGGYLGGRLVAVLPAAVVRAAIIGLGTIMTVSYAYRYWLA